MDAQKYKLVVEQGCFFIIDTEKERVALYIDTVERELADLTGDKIIVDFYGENRS